MAVGVRVRVVSGESAYEMFSLVYCLKIERTREKLNLMKYEWECRQNESYVCSHK